MQFDAFISYSHADERLVRALQQALESIDQPVRPRRRVKIFRDQSDLSPGQPLPNSLRNALEGATQLIVVVSPAAVESYWVNREIEAFLELHPGHTPMIVRAPGSVLAWDRGRNTFTADSTPLPPALAAAITAEPFLVDLSWVDGGTTLTLRNPEVRGAVAALASPLRNGRRPARIARREATKWWRRAGIAIATVASLVAIPYVAAAVNTRPPKITTNCAGGISPPEATDFTHYDDGAEIGVVMPDGSTIKPAMVVGGSPLMFQTAEAATHLAYNSVPTTRVAFTDLDGPRTPHAPLVDGMLLRERYNEADDHRSGRLVVAEGGALFPVADPAALEQLGLDAKNAIMVQPSTFQRKAFSPRPGSLIRLGESDRYWVIDSHGKRFVPSRVCTKRTIVKVPDTRGVLSEIRISPRESLRDATDERAASRDTSSPWFQADVCANFNGVLAVSGKLENLTNRRRDFTVWVQVFGPGGFRSTARHITVKSAAPMGGAGPVQASFDDQWRPKSEVADPHCWFAAYSGSRPPLPPNPDASTTSSTSIADRVTTSTTRRAVTTTSSSSNPTTTSSTRLMHVESRTVAGTAGIYLARPPQSGSVCSTATAMRSAGTPPTPVPVNGGDTLSISATGLVNTGLPGEVSPAQGLPPDGGTQDNSSKGYHLSSTYVKPANGLSGISGSGVMFLVGVFTGSDAGVDNQVYPSDYSSLFAPKMNRVFFIGSGRHYRLVVPEGASNLYLGIADAWDPVAKVVNGCPGYYDDNSGAFSVTLTFNPR